jgi:two-component system response regulator YesN
MIRLFIADDEQIVIDSIKFIIEKNDVKADIIGFAKSGREAIEKVEILKPDVVFMDIKMPGIDGIEAIKQIKERHKDIIFVIITAYEYFNYAKEAIDLGVLDYLLKPLNRNKVVEAIKKAIEVIEKRREAMLKELELKEKLNKIIPYLEGQFLYTTLFSGITYDDLSFYEEIFGIKLQRGYAMIVTVDDVDNNLKGQTLKLSIDKQNFYDHFKTIVKNIKKVSCIIKCNR